MSSLNQFKTKIMLENPEEAVEISWNNYSSSTILTILNGKIAQNLQNEENRDLKKCFKVLAEYLNQFLIYDHARNKFFMRLAVNKPYCERTISHVREMLNIHKGLYTAYTTSEFGVTKYSQTVWDPSQPSGSFMGVGQASNFNIFTPLDVEIRNEDFPECSVEEMDIALSPLLTLFKKTICGDSPVNERMMVKYLGDIIIYHKKIDRIIAIFGLGGIGKSLFFNIIRKMIGSHLSLKSNVCRLKYHFNSTMGRKLLVHCEGSPSNLSKATWQKVKNVSDSGLIISRQKIIETQANFIFLGNASDIIDDRKVFKIYSSSELGNQSRASTNILSQLHSMLTKDNEETWRILVYFYRWLKIKYHQ